MHAFLLRLPAPPYLQGPLDLAVLSKSRQSVNQSVSQSAVSACPGRPISPARKVHSSLFLIANAFHFCILALSMSSILGIIGKSDKVP